MRFEAQCTEQQRVGVGRVGRRVVVGAAARVPRMRIEPGQERAQRADRRTLATAAGSVEPGECRIGDVRHCFPDMSKARAMLGFEPRYSLAAGLKKLVGWLDGRIAVDRVGEARAALAARGLTL